MEVTVHLRCTFFLIASFQVQSNSFDSESHTKSETTYSKVSELPLWAFSMSSPGICWGLTRTVSLTKP